MTNDHPKLSIDSPIKWVDITTLKENPKNPNKHPEDQIERLADIIRYQGFRHPIIVSNQSGLIVVGHGRKMAAEKLGLTKVPVQFQDFESPEQEYAFVVSDNSISQWADLDLSLINLELENLGPDFDIDLLGLKDFEIDPNFSPGNEDDQGQLDEKKMTKCPKCGEVFDHAENKS